MAKINDDKLVELIHEGTSQVDCARYFGVSKSAIYQKLKKLGLKALRSQISQPGPPPQSISARTVEIVTGTENGNGGVNTLQQFETINRYANELLDLVMRWQRGDKVALQILESQVRKVNVGTRKEPEWIEEYKMKDPRELALKAMAEIRKQLEFQLNMYQMLYDMRAVQEFQQEVLTAIGEAAPDVRDTILHKLKEKRVIRAALQQP